MFRARGVMNNDSKYATAAKIYTLEQMLSYREVYTEAPSEGFDVFRIIHDSRSDKADKPKETLKMSENGWKQTDKTKMDEKDLAVRQVQNNLNKLTAKNFDDLCEQILSNEYILDDEVIPKIVNRFFEKALDEPVFAELYARLCFEIAKFEGQQNAQNSGRQQSNIRVSIINAAQNVFEHEGNFDAEHSDEEHLDQFRKRKINNIKFVAELFKHQMISRKIITHILKTKLMTAAVPSESDAEVSSELLMAIGYILDQDEGHGIENVFGRVDQLIKDGGYSNRIKFMFMNLLDLRKSGWAAKKKEEEKKKDDDLFLLTPSEFRAREAAAKAEADARKAAASGASPAASTPASPVYQDPAAPQFSEEELKAEEEARKAYNLAVPPSVDSAVERKVVNAIKEVLDDTKEGYQRDTALLKAVNEDLSSIIPKCTERDSRTASVCFIAKYACSSSRQDEREKMISVLLNKNVWKDKNELFRGFSWCFVSCIADGIKEDCPKFFERYAEAIVKMVETGCAEFKNIVKDIFARSANYLHAVSAYEKELYSYEWDEEFTNCWEHVVKQIVDDTSTATTTLSKDIIPQAREILDQFGSLKVSEFLARVTCDVVGALMEQGLCTTEELREWVDEKNVLLKDQNKNKKLGSNNVERLVEEVSMLC